MTERPLWVSGGSANTIQAEPSEGLYPEGHQAPTGPTADHRAQRVTSSLLGSEPTHGILEGHLPTPSLPQKQDREGKPIPNSQL